MNRIDLQIEVARTRFEFINNRKPTKLLLGCDEMRAMILFVDAAFGQWIETTEGPRRSEYRGMAIYKMDDESFLGVA